MAHRNNIAVTCLLLGLFPGSFAFAEGGPKKPAKTPRQLVFEKYDLDHNQNLDVSESITLSRAYKDNPKDPVIKPFDLNSDGTMSDQELMKIIYPNGQPKPKATPKKGKPQAKAKGKPKAHGKGKAKK